MKFFSDKSLFRIIFAKSLILLFVPIRKIMFVGERFEYGFRSYKVAPQKILTLSEIDFAPDRLY